MAGLKNVIVILSVVLFQVIYCEEISEKLHRECVAETGVSEERIPNAMKGDFPEDDKFKCYLKCVSVGAGAMSADGNVIVTEEVLKILPQTHREAVREMARVCSPKMKSTELCQRAFEFHKCAYDLKPEKYILF